MRSNILRRPRREQKEFKRLYTCKSNALEISSTDDRYESTDTRGTFNTKQNKYQEIHSLKEIQNGKDTEKNLKGARKIDDNHTKLTHVNSNNGSQKRIK